MTWQFPAGTREIALDKPRVYHLSAWGSMGDQRRVAFLRQVAEQRGRDPRIRDLAARILAQAGVDQRQYEQQAAALLKWVQTNIAYINEPGEILQDPLITLERKYGDCDDLAILLASLFEAVRLQWRFVLSGAHPRTRQKARWVEGEPYPRGVVWAHIYVRVGWPPFGQVAVWRWAEPCVKGVPLGWDVTDHMARTGRTSMPELAGPYGAVAPYGMANPMAGMNASHIAVQVAIGVGVSIIASLILDEIKAHRRAAAARRERGGKRDDWYLNTFDKD
jgi:transglutaminase-like putative cysteine protease